jgi:hypothetical protein
MDAILAEGESGLDDLVGNLARNGWAVAAQALSPGLVDGLRAEVARREGAGELQPAGVGRQRVARAGDVRRACAGWLDGRSPAETEFLRTADDLRRALNRRLYLGLFEFEAQFLLYPPGASTRATSTASAGRAAASCRSSPTSTRAGVRRTAASS